MRHAEGDTHSDIVSTAESLETLCELELDSMKQVVFLVSIDGKIPTHHIDFDSALSCSEKHIQTEVLDAPFRFNHAEFTRFAAKIHETTRVCVFGGVVIDKVELL